MPRTRRKYPKAKRPSIAPYVTVGDFGGSYGYFAQPPDGPKRFFAISKHGDQKARRLALAHAARFTDRGRANPLTGAYVKRGASLRSRSGSLGVHRVIAVRHGRKYPVWIAALLKADGRIKRVQFSIGKWGEKKARRKAEEARAQMVAEKLA